MKTSGLISAMRSALGLGGAGVPPLSPPPEAPSLAVPLTVSDVRGASRDESLAGVAATLLARLDQGERFGGAADVAAAEDLRQRLAAAADVHENVFSARRYRDLLMPVLSQVAPEDLAGATVVDLDCGTVNPFTFSFLLLLLGAERAYAIDAAPVSDLAVATRALATAAGWLLVEPHRLFDRVLVSAADVVRHLHGFDLSRLSNGDPTGLAPGRLIHKRETLLDLSLRAGEADVVFSVSLLEHLPVDEALDALRRVTKPGGLGVHVVDLVDHRYYGNEVASPHAFLAEPPTEALVHGSNRLRSHEWRARFEKHGFAVERVEEWSNQPAPTADEHAQFAEPYRSMERARLTVTGARLFVRREGATPGRPMRRVRPASPDPPPGAEPPALDGPASPTAEQVYQSLVATASGVRGRDYVAWDEQPAADLAALVKLIAFYLPQYHPIPQNDEWWGRGFTEWTNVSKAAPQFVGHYQPHLPGELGFYDLRVPEVLRRQVDLARQYGIAGFCFYYYWFGGTRLLERPLEQFMADPAINFPFCVSWANENWTRRWDGREDQVLIAQDHGCDSDAQFIVDLEPVLRHRHYLRVNGRPVVLVYRPMLLHDPAATAARWREHCQRAGLGNPYLVATHSFDSVDPLSIGFDAAVEFPPNTGGRALPMDITSSLVAANPRYSGTVYRYDDMWRGRLERPAPPYPFFRGVCPGFDNEARRPGNGSTYAFSTPASYGRWLEAACRVALREPEADKRLVFLNAWNEWAEGAHLEPDQRFGYAYLSATRKVMQGLHQDWTMLVVSHDACRGGAQRVLLEYVAWLTRHTAIRVKVLCLGPGEWLPRFQALADTVLWSELEARAAAARAPDVSDQLQQFCGGTPAVSYANTVASGRVYAALQRLGAPIVTHVHELENSIHRYAGEWIDDVVALSAHFIACSEPVRQNLVATHGVAARLVTMVHSSIDSRAGSAPLDRIGKANLRRALGLPDDPCLVVGCGIGMPYRKGADLFIEVGRRLRQRGVTGIHLGWIGAFPGPEADPEHGEWASHLARLQAEGLAVTFLGVKDDVTPYLRAADVFLLTSREDPFPLVALEAAACGLPIVCFAEAGGMPAFVAADAGAVVPFGDVDAMATQVAALCDADARRLDLGTRARQKWQARFTTAFTAPHLLSVCRTAAGRTPAVSVIVPNYNHARYLRQRLDGIFAQTFRDLEVIVLDDASTDDSLAVVAEYQDRADVRVILSEQNSGSTFAQWLKGIDAARADVIWMAESDDGCAPEFLETLLPLLRDPRVKLAYANSHVWNEQSEVVGDYTGNPYLTTLSATKWASAYRVSAEQEMNEGLGVKNTILSASAVLFRKCDVDVATRSALQSMHVAGDWLFYAYAVAEGDIAYTPKKLNFHRRHDESVVGKLLKQNRVEQFFREFAAVQTWIADHYRLDGAFEAKWEHYLREQWDAFFPGRPFEEIENYYPLGALRARLAASRTSAGPA